MKEKNKFLSEILSFIVLMIGCIIFAVNLKTFIKSANIVPGGFTGLAIIIQNLLHDNLHISITLTLINFLLNIVPAIFSFFIIGKRFTILSFIAMLACSGIADFIPDLYVTNDLLLASVFAGLINGFASSLMLRGGASSGGTDFITLSISQVYHINTFNFSLMFNILLIAVHGANYGIDKALYSIIFQFTSTQVLNVLYKHFNKLTLLIVTTKPDEISNIISTTSKHTATKLDATGCFTNTKKSLIYTMITSPEQQQIVKSIKQIDPNAFINVIKSDEVLGNFTYLPIGYKEL